ncbi:hypothetical protein [Paraburkholderia kururiensis]|uniref:hypothetical protein n=1 Tax=Paraburkholderia kururiensis TaxID=984307 RepID=UPI0012E0071D|nr:hypothetical protein [Paraburkholderia kururiensis]
MNIDQTSSGALPERARLRLTMKSIRNANYRNGMRFVKDISPKPTPNACGSRIQTSGNYCLSGRGLSNGFFVSSRASAETMGTA